MTIDSEKLLEHLESELDSVVTESYKYNSAANTENDRTLERICKTVVPLFDLLKLRDKTAAEILESEVSERTKRTALKLFDSGELIDAFIDLSKKQ